MSDVRRAVHAQHAPLRQQVVHDGEDGLLDLAGIRRPADENHLAREARNDEGFGAGSVDVRGRLEAGRLNHGESGGEALEP